MDLYKAYLHTLMEVDSATGDAWGEFMSEVKPASSRVDDLFQAALGVRWGDESLDILKAPAKPDSASSDKPPDL